MGGVSSEVAGPALVRRLNAGRLLDELRRSETMSTNELVEATGMSRPTVHAAAEHLIKLGWASEGSSSKAGRGRPSRVFSFRETAGYVLGVDIGAHTVRARVADLRGEDVVSMERAFTDPEIGPEERIRQVRELLTDTLAEAELEPGRVLAVCVGSSGPISPDGVVRLRTGIPGFLDLDLRTEMARGFDWDVVVENDCNLAAIGERWRGLAVGKDNVVCLLAGERLGAGIILDGRLVRGHRNSAGGVLFLKLMQNPSAGEGVAYLARKFAGKDAPEVFDALVAGDPAAAEVIGRAIEPVASVIATVGMLLDPELVVLSGAVAAAGEALMEPIRRRLAELSIAVPEVAASPLRHNAVVTGAVRLALERAESRYLAELVTAPA
ncbi:ROK family transcriptional regulator [Amycolatopsis acidicola]|uniref:ROK family transcriptional regulator n=1 Tax=Amycolatopsis acidicola TaxID=2596893 RepID=A0A5N0US68_9PSEU|nr:ROK family transcriptional regulator [Amycolatopsis acidicola]KAA9154592.1 ROK family transcriptional regulator [Amycolatopsis acidicola]